MAEFGDLLLVLVFAGIGAWIASYVREKGKNYATQEDIQKLTRLAEEVRAEVTGKAWLDQKRWDLRRDFYWELLSVLNQFSAALRAMAQVGEQPHKDYEAAVRRLEQVSQTFRPLSTRLVSLVGIARIILPERVVTLLTDLDQRIGMIGYEIEGKVEALISRAMEGSEGLSREEHRARLDACSKEIKQLVAHATQQVVRECKAAAEQVAASARTDLLSFDRQQLASEVQPGGQP